MFAVVMVNLENPKEMYVMNGFSTEEKARDWMLENCTKTWKGKIVTSYNCV